MKIILNKGWDPLIHSEGTYEKLNHLKFNITFFYRISIVVMIFANYGCGGYAILEHAVWNGLHFADLVFPWFMWIMGVCIPISINSSLKKEINKKYVILNITRVSIHHWNI